MKTVKVINNPTAVDAARRRELGQIHQGKAALAWSDDDYRVHLRRLTDKSSAADLDAAGRRRVLDHMARCGWIPKRAFKPFGQPEKIKWLWRKLGETGTLKNRNNHALLTFVTRTTGMEVADVQFLPVSQASVVIEALKSWLNRESQR